MFVAERRHFFLVGWSFFKPPLPLKPSSSIGRELSLVSFCATFAAFLSNEGTNSSFLILPPSSKQKTGLSQDNNRSLANNSRRRDREKEGRGLTKRRMAPPKSVLLFSLPPQQWIWGTQVAVTESLFFPILGLKLLIL